MPEPNQSLNNIMKNTNSVQVDEDKKKPKLTKENAVRK